jgi:hypothetical protein
MVNSGGRGRFQKVAAHAGVNQTTDATTVQTGRFDCDLATSNARAAGQCSRGPDAPLNDPAHQFESTFGEFQAVVKRTQLTLDLLAAPNFRRDFSADRFQADIRELQVWL